MILLTRADLASAWPNAGPKVIQAFEQFLAQVDADAVAISTGSAATIGLQNATVITTSSNDAFANERIVEAGTGIRLTDTGVALVVALAFRLAINGNFRLGFNLQADTYYTSAESGTIMVEEAARAILGEYDSDSAARAAGVPFNGLYRTGNAVKVCVT